VKGGQHAFDGAATANAKLDDLPNLLLTPKLEPYSLRWAAISAITGKLLPQVDVSATNMETGKVIFDGQTTADGRSPRQRDEKQAQEFSTLIGSGEWVTEITTDEDPQMLDNEEWMDWEAEDE
jgi:type VI secretion system secreted protein VgrG